MKRTLSGLLLLWSGILVSLGACGEAEEGEASGGSHAGGAPAGGKAGDSSSSGGASGGVSGAGGVSGSGGGTAAGGGSGGNSSTGGASGTGGGPHTGGAPGSGGASGTGGSIGTGGTGPAECAAVTAQDVRRDDLWVWNTVVATVQPDQGSPDLADELSIGFYEIRNPVVAGTFDLAQGEDANYSTCQHCLIVREDYVSADESFSKLYFPVSGTLNLIYIDSPTNGRFAGSLSNVKLVEVSIGEGYVSTPVPGGACLTLDSMEWEFPDPV